MLLPHSTVALVYLREVQPAHSCQIQIDLDLQQEGYMGLVWLQALPHHTSTL